MKREIMRFKKNDITIVFNYPTGFILIGFIVQNNSSREYQKVEIIKVVSSPVDNKEKLNSGDTLQVPVENIYPIREWIDQNLDKTFLDVLKDLVKEQVLWLEKKAHLRKALKKNITDEVDNEVVTAKLHQITIEEARIRNSIKILNRIINSTK